MASEPPSLHIDDDWKKQAQEEKRRLAEQQKQSETSPAAAAGGAAEPSVGPGAAAGTAPPGLGGTAAAAATAAARERGGEAPPPTFATLVQSLLTQILFYLGDLAPRGSQPQVNLDMAKHNIDLLSLLEQKTANNLTDEEKRLLDAALYETRMRYVSVASQYT